MRVAVTGAAGDFGTAILRRLVADDRVGEAVALDLREPRVEHEKVRYEACDVRSERVAELVSGCDAVVHLAFILIPGHDRDEASRINQEGSRNVVDACAKEGVGRLVVASSLSAYGSPRKGLPPAVEGEVPAEPDRRFYFREKAQVERMLDAWEAEHPESGMVITRLQPGFVYGPDFSNPALAMMGTPLAVLPDDGGRTHLIHQDDLARAFCEACFADHPGQYLIVTDESISQEDLAELSGGRVARVPVRLVEVALDAAHALRLAPVSSDWAVSGDRESRLGRARAELGWEPSMTSRESALALLAQQGRRLRYADGPPRHEVAERMLEVPTAWLREAAGVLPGLATLDLDATLERLAHDWIEHRGERIHLEVHEAGEGSATVVYAHGLGDHARRSTPLGGALANAGLNAVLIDRYGHGISEGRRGDAPLEADLAVLEAAIAHARQRFGGPVVLMGDSLGGIMSWYLLTREPDVEAVVCHCINHPEMNNDPSLRWKAPLLKGIARVAPTLRIPVEQIADYSQVALEPLTSRYFTDRPDRLFNFTITARAAASYVSFEPRIPWEQVTTPVLVTIGDEDRMTSRAHTERCLARAQPPRTTFMPMAGMGHQLYLDHLAEALPPALEWIDRALAGEPAAVA
jgi:nucleoside-diphosphate-sugar epimerase/alpha-beta hydrolase superfamily lysophospholipase